MYIIPFIETVALYATFETTWEHERKSCFGITLADMPGLGAGQVLLAQSG